MKEKEKASESAMPVSVTRSDAVSEPSPNKVVREPGSTSSSVDLHFDREQLIRMGKALELDVMCSVPQSFCPVFKVLYPISLRPVAFPMLEDLLDIAKGLWAKPASVPLRARKLEAMYKVKKEGCEFLFTNPIANSLVAEVFPSRRSGAHIFPFEKEGRKLDFLGRKIYTSAALSLRIANLNAIMGGYQTFLWENITQHLDTLSDDKRSLVKLIQTEGIKIGKQQISAACHLVDTASKAMASAVVLRRHSWLRATGFPSNIRARVEDLPFEGKGVFSTRTDEMLHQIRKNKLLARALGIMAPPAQGFRPRYFCRRLSHQRYQRPSMFQPTQHQEDPFSHH